MVFDRKKYKEFAQIQLNKRRGLPALITFITLIVVFLVNLPIQLKTMSGYTGLLNSILEDPEIFNDMSFLEILQYYTDFFPKTSLALSWGLIFLEAIISVIFSFAAYNYYFAMSRSPEPVKFSVYFEGFNNWGTAVLAWLWKFLWLFIWGLLCIPVYLGVVLVIAIFTIILPSPVNAIVMAILLVPGVLLVYMPILNKIVSYSMMYYLCAEFKNISVKKAMKISQRLCKGHWWDIVGMWFSFFGWFILNSFTNNILSLWLTPYYTMTKINMYHALLKDCLEKGIVTPEELGQTTFETEEKNEEKKIEADINTPAEDSEKSDDTDETLKEFFDEKTETNQEEKTND